MKLGSVIKAIRKHKGFKQKELAEKCEITQTYLSQIENNSKEPNLSTVKKIGSVLGTPVPILFFLSMESEDVDSEKKEIFEVIGSQMQSVIKKILFATQEQ